MNQHLEELGTIAARATRDGRITWQQGLEEGSIRGLLGSDLVRLQYPAKTGTQLLLLELLRNQDSHPEVSILHPGEPEYPIFFNLHRLACQQLKKKEEFENTAAESEAQSLPDEAHHQTPTAPGPTRIRQIAQNMTNRYYRDIYSPGGQQEETQQTTVDNFDPAGTGRRPSPSSSGDLRQIDKSLNRLADLLESFQGPLDTLQQSTTSQGVARDLPWSALSEVSRRKDAFDRIRAQQHQDLSIREQLQFISCALITLLDFLFQKLDEPEETQDHPDSDEVTTYRRSRAGR